MIEKLWSNFSSASDSSFMVKMTRLFLEVYRMWDFHYSRMRILHFNICGYRMWILYILLYWGYENEFQPQMMKKTQKIMQLLNYWMDESAINGWNIKIWCLKQWNYIKNKNLLKQNYLFHRNFQFQKFIKTSPSVLPGCWTRTKLICPQPTSFLNHHTVVGETPHNTH